MMKSTLIAAVVALGLTTACESTTGISNRTVGSTAAGAVIGAGLGTLAGGNDKRNAAIGAVVGGIAGASVGVYMNKQEEKLRQQTAGTGIEVSRQGDQIALIMPSNITFAVNSAEIQPGFKNSLNEVAATLMEYPSTAVDIIGHASSDGDDAYNQALSERRAAAVQSYLVSQGLRPIRISAIGMGERQPIADNATAAGRAANRRVEILLTPIVE